MKVFPDGSKYARIAGITAERPAHNYKQPLWSGHKEKYITQKFILWRNLNYGIFQSAVGTLQTLVIALGAGLGIWGAINLMEGYGNDNPGAKSQGMKQLMAN